MRQGVLRCCLTLLLLLLHAGPLDAAAAISRQAEGYSTSALPTLRSQAELEAYQRAIVASGGPVPVQATAGADAAAAAGVPSLAGSADAAGAAAVPVRPSYAHSLPLLDPMFHVLMVVLPLQMLTLFQRG